MKKCRIFYGTVVNDTGGKWIDQGSHVLEPVGVEGREPLGEKPDFCCTAFKDIWNKGFVFRFFSNHRTEQLYIQMGVVSGRPQKINYCPFCGAKIVLVEHLKLMAIEEKKEHYEYHYKAV